MKRKISAQEKLRILEEVRQPNTTIAEVCRRHQISPAQFYAWAKAHHAVGFRSLRSQENYRHHCQARRFLDALVLHE